VISVALKEWAIICDLLLEGRMAILLRKGGIHEAGGAGRFELEHPRFLLFPSWAHQKPEMIKPEFRAKVQVLDEPPTITMHGWAEVGRIWRVPSRTAFDSLDDLHPWTREQIDMRFDYKPQNPLYLMAVRAYRLASPGTVRNEPGYAGCKSWVPLNPGDAMDPSGSSVAVGDEAFSSVVTRVDDVMG
jgi:hypothetical protein